ncbi:MAG: NAD(P)/FAD-dependent oxidoreductase [Clostridia bacterium]|nr:NAD(P)/FAD-dependent oxidoreductase [Clostridia bacterium]
MNADVAIIGGGAAGLICAGFAAGRGLDTVIIERNSRMARKVMITGKGRCNVTNMCDLQQLIKSVPQNGRFLYSAFSAFSPYDIVDLLDQMGVPTKVERGNRVFPVSDKAVDVVDALVKFATQNGAKTVFSAATDIEIKDGEISSVICENGEVVDCKAVVIATGGLSYPKTGSTGDGYVFAKKAGHSIVPAVPSLVPVNVHEGYAARMQGLSLKNVAVKVIDNLSGKAVYDDFGEMMFTHFGLTGPVILSASAHMRNMQPEKYSVHIDLKPALDIDTLDARILRDFGEAANKIFANSLDKLLPKKMIPVIISLSGIEPTVKVNQITKEQRRKLCQIIKDLPFTVTGFRPIDEAIITSGGVSTAEINPKTMQSKLVPNLYFAGEVIDVDAYTGGFNLQIAFSTGCVAGKSVLQ